MAEKLSWKIEKRKIKDLAAFPGNSRKITKQGMEKLKDRIRKRGFHDVLKIDTDGTILSGHMRSEALTQLGIEEVDVKIPSRKLTDEEREAIVLESNRNDGEWDQNLLGEFQAEVLLDVGFESKEIDMLREVDEDEEDPFDAEEVVEQIKKPIAKYGEMYRLGDHLLMCGDSTKPEDLKKLMGGVKADMVFSDPPYNMNYKSHTKGGIMNDNLEEEVFVEFSDKFIARMKENLKGGGVYYICSGYNSYVPFRYALEKNKLEFSGVIVWVKNQLGMGMNDYRHSHEVIMKAKKGSVSKKKKAETMLYGWASGKHYFAGGHDEADVWEVKKRGTNTMVHPTQKPLALVNRAIKSSSKRDQVVLDLFIGSGSTLIACEKTMRRCYGMELDPKYIDAVVMRWEALTGKKAEKIC